MNMTFKIQNIKSILEKAVPLPGMGIKIIEVSRDNNRAVYAAEIPSKSPGKDM